MIIAPYMNMWFVWVPLTCTCTIEDEYRVCSSHKVITHTDSQFATIASINTCSSFKASTDIAIV